MEYKQLDYFLTVSREKSFSKAANKLFITQQGLSKSISNLERELDVPLFIRTNNGVELTKFGESFEKYAEILMNQHNYVLASIKQKKENIDDTISIGFATGILELFPEGFLSDFMLKHPESKFDIISFTDDACAQAILDYKINVGFCSGPIDTEFFDSYYTERSKFRVIIGANHPLAKNEKIYMQDLKNETLIALNTKSGSHEYLLDRCKSYGLTPSIYLNMAEKDLMGELCSNGLGICFFASRSDLLPDSVKVYEVEDLDLYWEFHLIVNKKTYLTDLAKEFIDYTKDQLLQKNRTMEVL